MPWKFNPFSNTLDQTGSGGGGSAFFAGEVATYADLPLDGTAALNSRWLVRSNSGTWPFSSYKQAGIYIRTATGGTDRDADYTLTDTSFHDVMSDDAFLIFDNTDPTKSLQFDVGTNVPTATKVTLTAPATSGTIALTSDLGTAAAEDTTAFAAATHASTHAAGGADELFDQDLNTTDAVEFDQLSTGVFLSTGQFDIGGETGITFSSEDGKINTRANLGLGDAAVADIGTGAGDVAAGDHTHTQLHDRSHAMTGTSDHTAGAHKIFYSDGSGNVQELALGATGTVLTSGGTAAAPSFAAAASGGTKTYATFTATDNNPPATAYATIDQRSSTAVLDFDDATDESAVFVGIIPEGASLGSGLKIRLHWMATSATSGNCVWDVSLERMTTDLDSDNFDTIASATAAASGTSGILTVTEITLTTIDSVTAGDGFRLKVTRDANNGSDNMSGDAELVAVEVRSAA